MDVMNDYYIKCFNGINIFINVYKIKNEHSQNCITHFKRSEIILCCPVVVINETSNGCWNIIAVWRLWGWAASGEDLEMENLGYESARLQRPELMIFRWMCGVDLKSRTVSAELNSRLGIECITAVARWSRLQWFGHVKRKNSERIMMIGFQNIEVWS